MKQRKATDQQKPKQGTHHQQEKLKHASKQGISFAISEYLALGASVLSAYSYFLPYFITPKHGGWKMKDYPLLLSEGLSTIYFAPIFVASIPILRSLLASKGLCASSIWKGISGWITLLSAIGSFILQIYAYFGLTTMNFGDLVKVRAASSFYVLLLANSMLIISGISSIQLPSLQKTSPSKLTVIISLVILLVAFGFVIAVRRKVEDQCVVDPKDLQVEQGFKVEVYAEVDEARQMFVSPETQNVYVGSRLKGLVHCIHFKTKLKLLLAKGMEQPNGIAMKGGDLYVAEISRIWVFKDIDKQVEEALKHNDTNYIADNVKPALWYDKLPSKKHHGWRYIKFGPDGKLYVAIGVPCNTCTPPEKTFATIMRQTDPNKAEFEIFAEGIRNTVGFDWDPKTKLLWFTENGRDFSSHDWPPDEINVAMEEGLHFGFPFVYGNQTLDPEVPKPKSFDINNYTPAAFNLEPHAAALGVTFYTGEMFPAKYKNGFFVAEHGSWNSVKLRGYKVGFATFTADRKGIEKYEPFLQGFIKPNHIVGCGRPVDVVQMKDGSLLVSDDFTYRIYRVTYQSSK